MCQKGIWVSPKRWTSLWNLSRFFFCWLVVGLDRSPHVDYTVRPPLFATLLAVMQRVAWGCQRAAESFDAASYQPLLLFCLSFSVFVVKVLFSCIIYPIARSANAILCFAHVSILFHLSTHFLRRPSTDILETFPLWYGFSPKGSAAMPISWMCPLTIMRGENPQISPNVASNCKILITITRDVKDK